MARYVEGRNRSQNFLLPENVDDYVDENNPVRAIEVFVDALDLVRIPSEGGQAFRRNADTDSDGSRTVIPIDPGQP
jgi:transposase